MSYRRSYSGYRKSYSSAAQRNLSWVSGSSTTSADNVASFDTVTLPVNLNNNQGVQIYEVWCDVPQLDANGDLMKFSLTKTVKTAQPTIDAEDLIDHFDKFHILGAAGQVEVDRLMIHKHSPPVLVANSQLNITLTVKIGATSTVHWRIGYKVVQMPQKDLIAAFRNSQG